MKLIKAILSILLPIFLIFRFWRPDQPLVELLVFFVCAFFILYLTTPRRQLAARGDSRVECIAARKENVRFRLEDHPGFKEISRDRNHVVYQNNYGVMIYTEFRQIGSQKEDGESPLLLLILCLLTACVGLVLFHLGEVTWSQFPLAEHLKLTADRFSSLGKQLLRQGGLLIDRMAALGKHLLQRGERLISDLFGAVVDFIEKVKNLL